MRGRLLSSEASLASRLESWFSSGLSEEDIEKKEKN